MGRKRKRVRRIVGESVECTTCYRPKVPRGRDAPMGAANGMCSYECTGYMKEPYVGDLWPGEVADDPLGDWE